MQIHVLEYLERTAARHAGKIALIDEAQRFTFGEVDRRVRAIAAAIAPSRRRNAPVAVYLPKSAASVISFWGILASGNFYVPLDTKSPAARTRKIIDRLDPALIITDEDGAQALRESDIGADRLLLIDDAMLESGGDHPLVPSGHIDTDPAYVIFTSGSTGAPKGVTIAHRGIIDYIDWAVDTFAVGSDTVIGNQSPLFFDNSTLDLYLTLAAGATLVLIPEKTFAFPLRLMQTVAEERISLVFWVPSVLIQVANFDVLRAVSCPALKKVLFAGEVMPNKQLNYWRRAMPHALFANLYGPTEITVDCTYYIVDREFRDEEPLPIGFACRNTDVLILNDRNEATRTGEHGELCVRGSSLAHGYWNDPEKTAATFTQNPLNPHYPERIYRTGDLVYRNERGEIVFVGRKDYQVKHRGFRIELGEIELACGALPGVRQACALYDDKKQEICLFYEAGDDVTPADLRRQLGRDLPKYMIPTIYRRFDELPKNANAKIDRLALAEKVKEAV